MADASDLELEDLYSALAKAVDPAQAGSELDRRLRTDVMRRISTAYDAGDLTELRRIARELSLDDVVHRETTELYQDLVRLCEPDHATTDLDRQLRLDLRRRVDDAYSANNLDALRSLAREIGAEWVVVPLELTERGVTIYEAEDILRHYHLGVKRFKLVSSDEPYNTVVGTHPNPGTKVPLGSEIELLTSDGGRSKNSRPWWRRTDWLPWR